MKHIPFAALPAAERQALAELLLRNGMALQHVCISKMVPSSPDEAQGVATVTGAGWFRSYTADAGWLAVLERDLLALRSAAPRRSLQNIAADQE